MFKNFFEKLFKIVSSYKQLLLSGLGNTLIIAVIAFFIGLVIGTFVAAVRVTAKNGSKNPFILALDKVCAAYVAVIRGTPVVVQLLILYFVILAQSSLPELWVAVIGFGLNSGAYMSEIMRAGIQSVDKGQAEAGRSLGLSYSTTMFKVVLPQAVKNMLPTMVNELISLLKETSVAGYITVIDITMATQRIVSREYQAIVPYINLAIVYFVIVGILTLAMKALERRLAKSDKNN